MIIRSARPEDFEMPLDGFNTWITPVERFFVRTHVYTPKVDIANVRLAFTGGCIANLTASRVSTERVRKIRMFQPALSRMTERFAPQEQFRLGAVVG